MTATRRLSVVAAAALALARAAPAVEPLPGEAGRVERQRVYFTDTELLTQDARPVRFFSDVLQGQVVVISFMFARCTGACPLLCSKLNQVRRQLGGALPKGVRFVTLSVDPGHDTPLELKRFAERQRAVDDAWLFLTGGKAAVKLVVGKLGQWVEDPGDHSTAFIAGNTRTNHWTKIRPDAPPSAIADQVRLLLVESEAQAGAASAAVSPDPARPAAR